MSFGTRSRILRVLKLSAGSALTASCGAAFYTRRDRKETSTGWAFWPQPVFAATIRIGSDTESGVGSETTSFAQTREEQNESSSAKNSSGGIGGKIRSLVGGSSPEADGCCSMVAHRSLDRLREYLALDESSATGGIDSPAAEGGRPPRAVLVNLYGQAGVTPLMVAAYKGDEEAIEVLLQANADLNMCSCTNPKEENTRIIQLQTAAKSGASAGSRGRGAEWAHFIADRATGALSRQRIEGDIWRSYFSTLNPSTTGDGWTATDFALIAGRMETAALLVERGANKPSEITINFHAKRQASGFFATMSGANVTPQAKQDALEKAKLDIHLKLDQAIEKAAEHRRQLRSQFPLESRLQENIVGQAHAVSIVSSAIRRKENGWVDTESPLVLLFMGSSGIGKTETAKLVAKYMFGGDQSSASASTSAALNNMRRKQKEEEEEDELANGHPLLKQLSNLSKKSKKPENSSSSADEKQQPEWQKCFVRMDMTEFQSKHEVSKFIGAPPGYVGYDEGGQLVKKLQECPNAVVLLDEVEKAHPDVLTVMLQAFDEGRLTDGQGETVDCKDATFIMTSNLGQRQIADEAVRLREAVVSSGGHSISTVDGLTKKFKRNVVQPILRRHFGRDEFLGRINEIIFFLPFTLQEQQSLARKELEKWSQRALSRHRIELAWDSEVETQMAQGYDLRYGARSIKYEIDRTVIASVARAQEEGKVTRGCRVQLGVDKDALKAQAANLQKKADVEAHKRAELERRFAEGASEDDLDDGFDDKPRLSLSSSDWDDTDLCEEGDVVVPITMDITPNAVPLHSSRSAKSSSVFGGLFS